MGKQVNLQFPLGGINRGLSYRTQPPFETRDANNVRGFGGLEGLARGGQRPGLRTKYYENLGGPIRLLDQVSTASEEGSGLYYWYDEFDESLDEWTAVSWIGPLPPVKDSHGGTYEYNTTEVGGLYDAIPIDVSESYSINLLVIPWEDGHWGNYKIYCRMDNATPNATVDGVIVDIAIDNNGVYTGTLKVNSASIETESYSLTPGSTDVSSGIFKVLIVGDRIRVYWSGVEIIDQTVVASAAGERIAYGMQVNGTYPDAMCLIDSFTIYGTSNDGSSNSRDTYLVASANGNLFAEREIGQMTQVAGNAATFTDNHRIRTAERAQLLYVADYGAPVLEGTDGNVDSAGTKITAAGVSDWTAHGIDVNNHIVKIYGSDGNTENGSYRISSVAIGALNLQDSAGGSGSCSYSIEPAQKIYDPATNTVEVWKATSGHVPIGCPLICLYRDRMVLAKDHVWYMSRSGDPLDWDYSAEALDSLRAVAGTNSDAGLVGSPITALIPWSDDFLVFGTTKSTWGMRGDPASGGILDAISYDVGIVGSSAWCYGPRGEIYFLSQTGLFRLDPGARSLPVNLSNEKMPRSLVGIDPTQREVSLGWDPKQHGVMITHSDI